MIRALRTLTLPIAILAGASDIQAQEYASFVVFGDSLSDSGNVAEARGLPPGTAFTTNPDPVWAEIVARALGAPGTHSGLDGTAGGTNYAFGGACVDPDASCNYTSPNVGQQIEVHLSQRPAGAADPAALYAVWAGGNDIETILNPGDGIPRVDPQSAVPAAARALVAHVQRLQQAGARHVVVFNLPDLGKAPFALLGARANPQLPAALTQLSVLYNQGVEAGLRSLDTGVVPINAFALVNEIVAHPATYGFTDVQGVACTPIDPNLNSLACGPAGSGAPLTYEHGANRTHLFADLRHPGGAAHAMLGSAVLSTLAAPVQVSLGGEAGVAAVASHRRAVSGAGMSELDRPVGGWRGYASAQFGRHAVDAPPRLGEAQADLRALTLGAGHRAATDFWWGAALSLARHENGVDGADLDGDTVVASLHGMWRRGPLSLSGALNLGRSEVDVERSNLLGRAVRTERGSTTAPLFGLDVDLGWTFPGTGSFSHGPMVGLSWLDQEVEGYRESGNSSTAMHFSDFERGSLVLRGGYRFAGALEEEGMSLRPYAGIAYERELEDEPVSVTAGSNTMAGRFTGTGFAPPRHWVSVDAGLSASLGGQTSAILGYSGRYGDGGRKDHALNAVLRIDF